MLDPWTLTSAHSVETHPFLTSYHHLPLLDFGVERAVD
jgi:hypothetical protein